MAYSNKAKALRRCTAKKKDGEPCQAYAMWDHSEQLCSAHGGRTRGPDKTHQERIRALEANWQTKRKVRPLANGGSVVTEITRYKTRRETKQPSCKCKAYPFPHRHGSGFCRWPDEPILTTRRRRVSQMEAFTRWGVVTEVSPDSVTNLLKRLKEHQKL